MHGFATTLMIALPLQGAPEPSAAPQAQESAPEILQIRAACQKLAEAPSYACQERILEEGGGFGPRPGGGEAAAPAPTEFVAEVQKDRPIHFRMGDLEAWRQDGVLVHRTGSAAWERFDRQSGFPGGGRRGGGAGGGEGQAGPGVADAGRSMRSRFTLMGAGVAHELLAGLDGKVESVTRTEEGGKVVYAGALTGAGAAGLGGGRGFGRGPGGGQGSPAVQSSGTFRLVVNAQGMPESAVFDTVTKGSFGERQFERKRHLELQISSVGALNLEVPAEVAAKLQEKPAGPPDEF